MGGRSEESAEAVDWHDTAARHCGARRPERSFASLRMTASGRLSETAHESLLSQMPVADTSVRPSVFHPSVHPSNPPSFPVLDVPCLRPLGLSGTIAPSWQARCIVLDVTAIERQLPRGAGTGPVRVLGSVTSTNDIAWAWAGAGCAEGAAFFAEEQIQGRGRFGRTWHCPRGTGLLVSVVLRPPEASITPAHLTALSAVAVAEAIEEAAGVEAGLRWPNDVTVDEGKVAGVLVERRGRGASPPCVVGIGLNVNTEPQAFPVEVRETATSLRAVTGEPLEREAVAAALLRRLHERYRDCAEGRWDAVSAAWRERSSLVGQEIEVRSAGGAARGRVVAVDPLSGIELEMVGGERRCFAADSTSVIDPSLQHPDAHEALRR